MAKIPNLTVKFLTNIVLLKLIMTEISGGHYLASSREEAFDAGKRTINLPKKVKGISLNPLDKILRLHSIVPMTIDFHGRIVEIKNAEVTTFEEGSLTVVEGQSPHADVKFTLGLEDNDEEGGTDTSYLIEIDKKGTLAAIPDMILKRGLKPRVIEFANQYHANSDAYIKKMRKKSKVAVGGLTSKVMAG